MDLSFANKLDFRAMIESMSESVLITTPDLDPPGPYIIYVNPAFEKMTGWKKEEILGENPRVLQGPKTDHGIFIDMRSKLERGEFWSGRTINYKKDGSAFYMQWSIVPIRNEHGKTYQYLAMQNDVSSIVHTEEKLAISREAEKRRVIEIEKTNQKLNQLLSEQKKTLDLFVKYVPASIVKNALSNKKRPIALSQQLEAALLFCDIRGFTGIVETLNPSETVHLLNVYYSKMSEVINLYNGVINQFVGDEIFISFGAPTPIHDPEISAVRCALEMIKKLQEINKTLRDTINKEIFVGIGIHFGTIIAGNLGSEDRLSYSITGDAVNTAKRIESLTRNKPNSIFISQPIYEKIRSGIKTVALGEVAIKGKNEKVNVYKVIG